MDEYTIPQNVTELFGIIDIANPNSRFFPDNVRAKDYVTARYVLTYGTRAGTKTGQYTDKSIAKSSVSDF
jgi:hypothetical protein